MICDPYYYICGTYPIEAVIGSRGGWDFGFNIGAGVGFGLGDEGEFFIESKFHYVWGPEIPVGERPAAGQSRRQHQRTVPAPHVRLPLLDDRRCHEACGNQAVSS